MKKGDFCGNRISNAMKGFFSFRICKGKSATARMRDQGGESLAEILVALLIAALALVMLPGAITTAARINAATEEENKQKSQAVIDTSGAGENGTATYTGAVTGTSSILKYENGDYVYYKLP